MLSFIISITKSLYVVLVTTLHLTLANFLEMDVENDSYASSHAPNGGPLEGRSLWGYFLLTASLFAIWKLYKALFQPLDRIKDLTDVGWSHLLQEGMEKINVAHRIREVQRMRKTGDLPPVFPNGWFAIAESRFILKHEVKSVQCFGETLAVFRGEDGGLHVLDAYCPHLGANMGVGGVVRGNCLQCPFHGWKFSGKSGACTSVPYAKRVPEFTKVRRWTSCERNGFVFVWFDVEGRGAAWSVPSYEQIESGEFSYRGRTEHQVLAHIQEIPENGSDLAHLGHLHVPNIMKGADLTKAYSTNKILDVVHHEWKGSWRPLDAPQEHMAEVSIIHSFSLFSGRLNLFKMKVLAQQIGPGLVVLHLESFLGKGIIVQTVTPQEPLRQKLVHQFYFSSGFVAPIAKLIILAEAHHVERDIMIWNSKSFLSKPILLAEDKQVARFRRWYTQFYSKNSPRFTSFVKNGLQW